MANYCDGFFSFFIFNFFLNHSICLRFKASIQL